MSELSEQLAELMTEDGYTQTSLAKAMNTSGSKISLYLSGKSSPNFKVLVALIEFFNCSADFLLGLSEYPAREKKYNRVGSFGNRLRSLLCDFEISQYLFIKRTGISWSVLYNWLNNKSSPSADNVLKLASFFDCTVDFLLGREG